MTETLLTLGGVFVQLLAFGWYLSSRLARIEAALGIGGDTQSLQERVRELEIAAAGSRRGRRVEA